MGCASLLLACLSLTLPDTLHYTLTFSLNELAFDSIGGEDFVTLRGCQPILKEGSPSLPRFPAVFVIPAGSRVGDTWAVVQQSSSINGTFSIWPAQPPIPISWDDSIPTVPPDSAIYNSNSAWPSTVCQAADVGAVDGTYFARVDVFPLTWSPSSGALSLRTEIDISLEVIEDTIPAPDPVLMTDYFWDRRVEQLSALVLNPDDLEDFSEAPDLVSINARGSNGAPDAIDCLILTPGDWASSWQPLVDWNIQRGIYTEVLSLEAIQAEWHEQHPRWLQGRDWAETIRNCIRWQHENNGVQYFILGADSRNLTLGYLSEGLDIPARFGTPWRTITGGPLETYVTDWYFACLSPSWNWDTNNNGKWGEYHPTAIGRNDAMDLLPDICLGRIPAHSADEVSDAATRIVEYQHRRPNTSEPSLDLLIASAAAHYEGFPETYQHIQAMLAHISLTGLDVLWVSEDADTAHPGKIRITPTALCQYLDGSAQGGGAYRVQFGGHGGLAWIGANPYGDVLQNKVWDSDLRALAGSSGLLCTSWAFNCLTADFTDTDPTIGETWLGTDQEGIDAPLGPCYVGNTREGLMTQIAGGSTTHLLNKWFLESLYSGEPPLGQWGVAEPFNIAKMIYCSFYLQGYPGAIPPPVGPIDDSVEPMWDLKGAELLGDPACPIWIAAPLPLYVQHARELHCPAELALRVTTAQGAAVQGAFVCLMVESGQQYPIYIRGWTDGSGQFSSYLDPAQGAVLTVTVTRQNYMPYSGSVNLHVN